VQGYAESAWLEESIEIAVETGGLRPDARVGIAAFLCYTIVTKKQGRLHTLSVLLA